MSLSKLCTRRENEYERIDKVLDGIQSLTALQKTLIRFRYINLLREFSTRCTRYAYLYHVGHFVITVGSLIVPALLSVQYADTKLSIIPSAAVQAQIYWVTWVLSLLVTMFNGILVLYKVDKKYYFLHTTRESLRSEGWQYFELTGRYSGEGLDVTIVNTHSLQFAYFSNQIEKIRMRQIQEEYYKNEESNQTVGSNQAQKEFLPPSVTKDGTKRAKENLTVQAVVENMVVASGSSVKPINSIIEPPSSSEK